MKLITRSIERVFFDLTEHFITFTYMHGTTLISDLLLVFTLSIVVVYIFNKLKIPPIVGFLLTGLLIGPNGFHLIGMEEEVEIFAEIWGYSHSVLNWD